MTTPVPASNAPAPPRTFSRVAAWLRHWLGIADQRRDFDALGLTLSVKDQTNDGTRRDLEHHGTLLRDAVQQLNRVTGAVGSLDDRTTFYERRGALRASRKAYDAAVQKELRRREKLIRDHPELSLQGMEHVRATGTLPPSTNGADPGTESERTLSLVREAEGDGVDSA